MSLLTIAYMTSRVEPCFEWFFDSLHRECGGDYRGLEVLVVDYWAAENWRVTGQESSPASSPVSMVRTDPYEPTAAERAGQVRRVARLPEAHLLHVPPKPTVWQGRHRRTRENYFAKCNAHNTALALARGPWIAFVDDVSVLLPGWLGRVQRARERGYVVFGAYMKLRELEVRDGEVTSGSTVCQCKAEGCGGEFILDYQRKILPMNGTGRVEPDGKIICDRFGCGGECYAQGRDSRWPHGKDGEVVPAGGGWMAGCSMAAPLEAFLKINGYDERCDSLGAEDYIAGIYLDRQGFTFGYDRAMLTYESEERHHYTRPTGDNRQHPWLDTANGRVLEASFKRIDKGRSPDDKSHKMLEMAMSGPPRSEHGYDLRALRARVQAGEPFPLPNGPTHDWYDGQPVEEF